jgi:MFS family permease
MASNQVVGKGVGRTAEIGAATRLSSNGSLLAAILGSFFVRIGGAASGVMLGLFMAGQHRAGIAGSSALVVGLLTAAFYLSELLGSPICGFIVDRRGVRSVLLAGPVLGVVAAALCAVPSHVLLLSVARLVQGLSAALTVPAALAFLSDATQGHLNTRGKIMGFFEVTSIGGIAVGYALGGYLWHWLHRPGFWILASLYTVAVSLFVFIRAERMGKSARVPSTSFRAIGHAVDLMPSWLALSAAAGLWFGQAAFQLSGGHTRPNQLLTVGLSDTTIGMIFGVYTLLFAMGTVSWGFALNRTRLAFPMRLGPLGMIVGALALFEINHASTMGGTWFFSWLVVGIVGIAIETAYTPAALTLLAARSDVVRSGRGAVMGVYAMLLAGGQLAGALLGGIAAQEYGVDGLIGVTVVLAVLGFLTLPTLAAERIPLGSPVVVTGD